MLDGARVRKRRRQPQWQLLAREVHDPRRLAAPAVAEEQHPEVRTRLINKFSKATAKPVAFEGGDWERFVAYCARDVDCEMEVAAQFYGLAGERVAALAGRLGLQHLAPAALDGAAPPLQPAEQLRVGVGVGEAGEGGEAALGLARVGCIRQ